MKIKDKKHLEKLYEKLEIKDADPDRVNVYRCADNERHFTKTIDRHYGVTPMFISCNVCGGRSASSFYTDTMKEIEPTHEWFVPTLEETWTYVKTCPGMVYHILNGGLELREIKR